MTQNNAQSLNERPDRIARSSLSNPVSFSGHRNGNQILPQVSLPTTAKAFRRCFTVSFDGQASAPFMARRSGNNWKPSSSDALVSFGEGEVVAFRGPIIQTNLKTKPRCGVRIPALTTKAHWNLADRNSSRGQINPGTAGPATWWVARKRRPNRPDLVLVEHAKALESSVRTDEKPECGLSNGDMLIDLSRG